MRLHSRPGSGTAHLKGDTEHLPTLTHQNLTPTVQAWRDHGPAL
jgi:hypothetical protein